MPVHLNETLVSYLQSKKILDDQLHLGEGGENV